MRWVEEIKIDQNINILLFLRYKIDHQFAFLVKLVYWWETRLTLKFKKVNKKHGQGCISSTHVIRGVQNKLLQEDICDILSKILKNFKNETKNR